MRKKIPIGFQESILQNTKLGHFYKTPTGNLYPSSTTILSATDTEKEIGLNKWRDKVGHDVADYITNRSATIGTNVHRMIECYIKNVFLDIKPCLMSIAHFDNLKPLLKNIGDYYGNELRLWNDSLKIAGTADCVAYYNGKLSIVDYKTKRKQQKEEWIFDHFLQLSSYAYMFQKLQKIRVEQIVLLVSSETNHRQEYIKNPRDFFKYFCERLAQYYKSLSK